jgi:P4 family phage/plasmid primase-like protien
LSTDRGTVEAAHKYRQRGWRVIPLHFVGPDGLTCSCARGRNCGDSAGKHPIETAWQDTPPMSGADIEALWERRPRSNVGIATGTPSGFWVLDVDVTKGGKESLEALVAEHGKPPATYTIQTGSGGWQFYFALADGQDIRNSNDVKGNKGIDVRGTGGQVVAPPSRSAKGPYRVAKDVPLVQAPAWLVDLVTKEVSDTPTTYSADLPDRSNLDPAEQRRLDSYAATAIKSNLDRFDECKVGLGPNYKGPPWNITTFEVSCSLIEIANSPWNVYTIKAAHDDVAEFAPRDPGFDDITVNKIFDSALAKVGDKARAVPPGRPREPDFMDAPGVRVDPRLSDPSQAVGGSPTPDGLTGDQGGTSRLTSRDFIDPRDGLQTAMLSRAVMDMGPLAFGREGLFYSYTDGVWRMDPKVVRRRCAERLGNLFRPSHATTTEEFTSYRVPEIHCEPVKEIINFRNGVLDWATGELRPHSPDYMSTVQMGTYWNPDADCPMFDAFLAQSMTPDFVELTWELIGYLMYSGNPFQIAVLLHGAGGNGKGRLIAIIENLLGRENVSGEDLGALSENRFSTVNLYGKIANVAGDIDATYQESTARFKSIVGDDYVAAERKYGDRFAFKPWAVNLFSANKIPGSADVSQGYLRRWIMINMPNKPAKPDPTLAPRIIANELEGIAAKAIPALQRLMARGGFEIKGDVAAGKEEFAEAIDQVRQWAADVTIAAPDHHEAKTTLYSSYCAWAARNGAGKLGSKEFYHRLEGIGLRPAKVNGTRTYTGLMLASLSEQQAALTEQSTDDFFSNGSN